MKVSSTTENNLDESGWLKYAMNLKLPNSLYKLSTE